MTTVKVSPLSSVTSPPPKNTAVSLRIQSVAVLARAALFLVLIVRSHIVFAGYVKHPVALVCKALYLYISFPVDCLRRVYRVVENVDVSLAYIYFFYVESLRNAQVKVEIDFVFSAFRGLVRGYRIYERVLAEALYFYVRNLCFELREHFLCGLLIAVRAVLHYLAGGLHHVGEVVTYLSRLNAVLLDILVVFEVDAVLIFLHLQRLAQLFVLRRAVHDIEKYDVCGDTENCDDGKNYYCCAITVFKKGKRAVFARPIEVI